MVGDNLETVTRDYQQVWNNIQVELRSLRSQNVQVRLGEHDLASNEDSAHPEEYQVTNYRI